MKKKKRGRYEEKNKASRAYLPVSSPLRKNLEARSGYKDDRGRDTTSDLEKCHCANVHKKYKNEGPSRPACAGRKQKVYSTDNVGWQTGSSYGLDRSHRKRAPPGTRSRRERGSVMVAVDDSVQSKPTEDVEGKP